MIVPYQQIEVRNYNLHHCVHHKQGNQVLGKFFLYSLFFTAYKGKIREEKSIAYNHFDMT